MSNVFELFCNILQILQEQSKTWRHVCLKFLGKQVMGRQVPLFVLILLEHPSIHASIHACVHPFTHAYVQICTEIEFLRDFFHVIKCWSVCLVTRKLLLESQYGEREILVLEKGHQVQLVLFAYFQTSCVVCIHACYFHVFSVKKCI